MQFVKSILTKIKATFTSLSQPALPASTVSAPHIRALLLHLCNQDVEQATWLARWLAYPMRHPGVKMSAAIAVDGVQGAGASLLFERVIAPMYGEDAAIHFDALTNHARRQIKSKRYAIFYEIAPVDLFSGLIKDLLSSSSIVVKRHGQAAVSIPSSLNMVFLGEAAQGLDSGSRRFFTLKPLHSLPVELAAAVVQEIENGGLVEFHQYLTHDLDMGGFDQNTPAPRAAESVVAA